jgi:shikimate kinase
LKNGLQDWRRIYENRKPLYREVANLEIDTSSLPLAAIIGAITEGIQADERF